MIYIARWKAFFIIFICLVGIFFALPNILSPSLLASLPSWAQKTIHLGLELQGGSYLQFKADMDAVFKEQAESLASQVRSSLREKRIGYRSIQVIKEKEEGDSLQEIHKVRVTLRDLRDKEKILEVLKGYGEDYTAYTDAEGIISFHLTSVARTEKNKHVISQSIEVIRRRIDDTGTKNPAIQQQGDDRIIVQLPGIDDPKKVKELIGQTAQLSFHWVDDKAPPLQVNSQGKIVSSIPMGSEVALEKFPNGQVRYYIIRKKMEVSGEHLIDAQATFDSNGQPAVSLKFNHIGGRFFSKMSENVGKQFAIKLDNTILSAPVFKEYIAGASGQITGHFTVEGSNNLALLLRAGALPARLEVIEERSIGPTLGSDSIDAGKKATMISFILVATFMYLAYSLMGIFANIALVFNLIFLFAALGLLQATLTLPGIAGIALTIGMAVDANVLVFERIKEEIKRGQRVAAAIQSGYQRALPAIVDSNLTTLIGAAVLFEFGTGPIRGFAVTLALGIVISMFTSLSLTNLMLIAWVRKFKPKTLSI